MKTISNPPLYESTIWQEFNDGLRRPGGLELTEYAVDLAGLQTESLGRMLDIGCGAGITAGYISERFGIDMWGIDSSELLLNEARTAFTDRSFIKADAKKLPFEESSFGAVISECSLSLCQDLRSALKEIYRVLISCGRLIITDMYDKKTFHKNTTISKTINGKCCFERLRSIAEWQDLIRESGFNIIHNEDRSHDLASLTASIIFNYGSVDDFYTSMGLSGIDCEIKPGYFLIIAEKKKDYE